MKKLLLLLTFASVAFAQSLSKTGSGPPTWTYEVDPQGGGPITRIDITSSTNLQSLGASANNNASFTGSISGNTATWTGGALFATTGGFSITCNSCSGGSGNYSLNSGSWTGSLADVPLPIDLVFFRAIANEKKVDISWLTANEVDHAGFILEQQTKDGEWQRVYDFAHSAPISEEIGEGKLYRWTSEPPYLDEKINYRLKAVDIHGESEIVGSLYVRVSSNNEHREIFSSFSISDPYPNPFNPSTAIDFQVAGSSTSLAQVQIEIHNIRRQKVATLLNQPLPAGPHSVTWNAMDDHGRQVSSGIYLATFRISGDNRITIRKKKLVFLR